MLRNIRGLGRNEIFHAMLPDGTPGTAKTIGYAQQLIQEGLKNPQVRELTLMILRDAAVPGFDQLGEVHALYAWALANFYFRDDPVGYQYLQPVTGILRTRSGNCASLNLVLLPTLLGGVGYPTRAITIKSDSSMPEEFSHVYIEAQLKDGSWIPLDVARPDATFGLAPPEGSYWEKFAWPLTAGGESAGYLTGLRPLAFRGMRRHGMGFDWSSFGSEALQATPQILGGVATVLKAQNTPGIPYAAVGYPQAAAGPYGPAVGPEVSVSAGASSNWLVMAGLGVAAIIGIAMVVKR